MVELYVFLSLTEVHGAGLERVFAMVGFFYDGWISGFL